MNQYGLLSSVRHIINPLFHLTEPLYSGLFYLAPGVGFLAGSVAGGHVSDRTVIRYKAKRGGVRLAEDRLNGSLVWAFAVVPLGTLMYGWSVDHKVGGMGLPISSAFIEGFGLMAAFNGLNTYAAGEHPLCQLLHRPLYQLTDYNVTRGPSSIQGRGHQRQVHGAVLVWRRGRGRHGAPDRHHWRGVDVYIQYVVHSSLTVFPQSASTDDSALTATGCAILGGCAMVLISRCLVRETASRPRASMFSKKDSSLTP